MFCILGIYGDLQVTWQTNGQYEMLYIMLDFIVIQYELKRLID